MEVIQFGNPLRLILAFTPGVCGTACVTSKQQGLNERELSKRSSDLALSRGTHVLHAPELVRGQHGDRVGLDSGLRVPLKVCICCLALHLSTSGWV